MKRTNRQKLMEETKPEGTPQGSSADSGAPHNPAAVADAPAVTKWLDAFLTEDGASSPPAVITETPPAKPAETAPAAAPAAAPVAKPTEPHEGEPFAEPKPAAAAPAVTEPAAKPDTGTPPAPVVAAPTSPAVDALKAEWQKVRDTAVTELKKRYTFSAEDKEAIGEELADRLTNLAAIQHVNVYESVMNGIYTVLPQIIRDVLSFDTAKQQFQGAFFAKWKALEPFKADVEKAVQMYTSFNPKATTEQVINDVGLQLLISKKLPIPGVAGTGGESATPPAEAAPFTPAGAGGAGGPPVTQPDGKFVQFLSEE